MSHIAVSHLNGKHFQQRCCRAMMIFILLFCLWSSYLITPVDLTVKISNLRFYSVNYQTLLQWDALNSNKDAFYYVQYKVYGESWENKTDCLGIQENHCNMTLEMSSPERECEIILARVRVIAGNDSSTWKKSAQFHPFKDTNIGPPTVILDSTSNAISVNIGVPQIIRYSKCEVKINKKSTHFIISMSHESEMPKIYNTTENIWKITNLKSGSTYCITVQMELWNRMKKSMPSSIQCAYLDSALTKDILKGSVAAVLITVLVISMLGIYLALYNYVLHPKTHLPSNLILQTLDSKAIIHREDEYMFVPSTFESMHLTRYIHEVKESSPPVLQCKRYVTNEPVRKEYVNCGLKNGEQSHDNTESTVEMKNLSYATKTCSINEHYPHVSVLSHQMSAEMNRINKTYKMFDYLNNPKRPNYINNMTVLGDYYMNTAQKSSNSSHSYESFQKEPEKLTPVKQSCTNYFNQCE